MGIYAYSFSVITYKYPGTLHTVEGAIRALMLKQCTDLDAASEKLLDVGAVLNLVLRAVPIVVRIKPGELAKILEEYSKDAPVLVRYECSSEQFTLLVYSGFVAAAADLRTMVAGSRVLEMLSKVKCDQVKVSIYSLPQDSQFHAIAMSCRPREAEQIYGFSVVPVEAFSSDLWRAYRAQAGRLGLIIRLYSQDKALKGMHTPSILGAMRLLILQHIGREALESRLKRLGLPLELAEVLDRGRRYLLRIAGVVSLPSYSEELYTALPAAVIHEDFSERLSEAVAKRGADPRLAASIFTKLLQGLALLHLFESPHLGVAPSNIYLVEDPDEPDKIRPILAEPLGTTAPGWLSQLSAEFVDPLAVVRGSPSYDSDLYALALTAVYISAGKVPPHRRALAYTVLSRYTQIKVGEVSEYRDIAEEFAKSAEAYRRGNPEPLRKVSAAVEKLDSDAGVFKGLESVAETVKRCLTLDPEKRFRNALEALLELSKRSRSQPQS